MTRRIANPRLRGVVPGALFALLTFFLVQNAGAAPPHAGTRKHRAKRTSAAVRRPVHASGLRAVIDPVTGRLTRPTVSDANPGQAQAGIVAAPDDRPTADVPFEKNPQGGDVAKLDERYHEFEVAKIGVDGKLVRECVQGPAGVAAFKKAAAAQKPAPAREVK
jgi:hypothetical protein